MVSNEGIITKMDAVERFRFLRQAYNKIRGYGFKDSDDKDINMCGVVVCGEYIYATNNHFVGRIFIPDNDPPEYPRYWDYMADNEMDAIKSPPLNHPLSGKNSGEQRSLFYNYLTEKWENDIQNEEMMFSNIKSLKQFFFNWRDNLLKLKKDALLGAINAYVPKDKDKVSYSILIQNKPDKKEVYFKIMRIPKKAEEFEFTLPSHINPNRSPFDDYVEPGICSLNCYYLYHILQTFREFDIVDMCYDNNYEIPVVIKGVNPRVKWKPDIRFAIAQSKPKYSYSEKDLY